MGGADLATVSCRADYIRMTKESSSFCEYPACLGLGSEWTECCHKSNESESTVNAKRFKFIQDDELQELSKGFVPKNTAMSTKWALSRGKKREI